MHRDRGFWSRWSEDGERLYGASELDMLEGVAPGLCSCVVDVMDEDGELPAKAGPCVHFAGYEPFMLRRNKLDGCTTGARLAKDRAAHAVTEVMIPETLDYPL